KRVKRRGLAREHVHEHAQVNRLAGAARAHDRDQPRSDFHRLRPVSQRHRGEAMPAEIGIVRVWAVAYITGDLPRVLRQPVRIEWNVNRFAQTLASFGTSASGSSVRMDSSSPAHSARLGSMSHAPRANRNPMLCLRLSGLSPLW